MTTPRFRPRELLCYGCKVARDRWALRQGAVYVPSTPAPEPCPPCVTRCDAARFALAAQGKDPIRTRHYIATDGTPSTEEILYGVAEADLLPFVP